MTARWFRAVAALVVAGLAAAIGAVVLLGRPAPLALVEAVPADGSRAVPAASRVTLTFSRPLDEASAETAVEVAPAVDGFASAAGRRLAFTPRRGFAADTDYALTITDRLRDRAGRRLPAPVVIRFRTRGQALVVRTAEGRLARVPVAAGASPVAAGASFAAGAPWGAPAAVAGPGAAAFAVGPAGEVAYVLPGERALAVAGPLDQRALRIVLPRGLEVRDMAFAPAGRTLLVLAAEGSGVGVPYLVRLDVAAPALAPFGPRPERLSSEGPFIVEALKKSLVEVVYRRQTFAWSPDGRAAILRDRAWDFALFSLDGARRATLGPFLAVGEVSPTGESVFVVDVDVADGRLPRQVFALGRNGALRALSPADRDSFDPRVAHRGERVAFASAAPQGPPGARPFAIEIADLASGGRRRLTDPPPGQADREPRWSPDDAWISFRRAPLEAPERSAVWLVPSAGGEARPLPGDVVDGRWSP